MGNGSPALPPLSCEVHTRQTSSPTSNNSSSSYPKDSQKPVKRPGATAISRTSFLPLCRYPLPIPNAHSPHPCPSGPCLVVCTVCIALRREGATGMRGRGWREGKLVTDPLSPGPTSPNLLASPERPGGSVQWEGSPRTPPSPLPQSLVEQVLLGGPASNLHT